MLALIVCCLIGSAVVLIAEYYHKKQKIVTETTRKIIHITHGLTLVGLIFLTAPWLIIAAEVVFFVLALIARRYKLFKSQHDPGRKTWGEFFFPIGVIAILLINTPRWIFILAILNLAFADAAAALVGTRYGKKNSYTVFGQKKSLFGSMAFFAVSAILISVALVVSPSAVASTSTMMIYWVPFMATLSENVGAFGSDNLWILLTIALLLH